MKYKIDSTFKPTSSIEETLKHLWKGRELTYIYSEDRLYLENNSFIPSAPIYSYNDLDQYHCGNKLLTLYDLLIHYPLIGLSVIYKDQWFDNTGHSVLCWVWNEFYINKKIRLINEYSNYKYIDDDKIAWTQACPLSPEEISDYSYYSLKGEL